MSFPLSKPFTRLERIASSHETRRRFLHCSAVFVLGGTVLGLRRNVQADSSPLIGARQPYRVRAELSLQGNLHLAKNALVSKKVARRVPISSEASFDYVEQQVQSVGETPSQTAAYVRWYQEASAKSRIHQTQNACKLRAEAKRITVLQAGNDELVFSRGTPLRREEIDLLALPVSIAQLNGFLPQAIEILDQQDQYQLSQEGLSAVMQLNEVSSHQVIGRIKSRSDTEIKLQIEGELTGKRQGTATQLKLAGNLTYDKQQQGCSGLALSIVENREVSVAEPGFEISATLRLQLIPLAKDQVPSQNEWLPIAIDEIEPQEKLIEQSSEYLKIQLLTDRFWHMITDVPGLAMMRMIDQGEVIAQCDFRSPPSFVAGKRHSLEAFQGEVVQTLGEQLGELTEAEIISGEGEMETLRVVATGQAQGVPIRWVFLHFSNKSGRRLLATFAMQAGLRDRFDDADTQIRRGLNFLPFDGDQSGGVSARSAPKSDSGEFQQVKTSEKSDPKLQSTSVN